MKLEQLIITWKGRHLTLALFASNLTLSKVEQYVHDWLFNKKLKSLIRKSLIPTASTILLGN